MYKEYDSMGQPPVSIGVVQPTLILYLVEEM